MKRQMIAVALLMLFCLIGCQTAPPLERPPTETAHTPPTQIPPTNTVAPSSTPTPEPTMNVEEYVRGVLDSVDLCASALGRSEEHFQEVVEDSTLFTDGEWILELNDIGSEMHSTARSCIEENNPPPDAQAIGDGLQEACEIVSVNGVLLMGVAEALASGNFALANEYLDTAMTVKSDAYSHLSDVVDMATDLLID